MRIFVLLLILFTASIGISCKCGWAGNFLRVAPAEDLVVKARILEHYKHGHSWTEVKMQVEIITVFKGQETKKRIMVWGDDGKSCKPYVNNFKKGNMYYLALDREEKDYDISACGEYSLPVTNDEVKMQKNEDDSIAPMVMSTTAFEKLLSEEIK